MPPFFFDLHNGSGFLKDEEGQEAPNLGAARSRAIASIRSILSEEVKEGRLDLSGRLDITNEAGEVLAVVPFAEALDLCIGLETG